MKTPWRISFEIRGNKMVFEAVKQEAESFSVAMNLNNFQFMMNIGVLSSKVSSAFIIINQIFPMKNFPE